jgi:hypothetical protein
MTSASGKASLISSKTGPEKLFSATLVMTVDTLNAFAAWATSPALLRSSMAPMDLVANAICDWWSIMMSV